MAEPLSPETLGWLSVGAFAFFLLGAAMLLAAYEARRLNMASTLSAACTAIGIIVGGSGLVLSLLYGVAAMPDPIRERFTYALIGGVVGAAFCACLALLVRLLLDIRRQRRSDARWPKG